MNIPYCWLFAFGILSLSVQAEIVSENPEDTQSLVLAHLGGDTLTMTDFGNSTELIVSSDELSEVIGTSADFTTSFSRGLTLDAVFGVGCVFTRLDGVFDGGSGEGLNYLRMDMDGNEVFETVVEFQIDSSQGFAGSLFTRYAYDSTGGDLDIPEALAALNAGVVVEQSVTEVSRIQRLSDGTVILSWESDLPEETDFVLRATDDPSLPLSMWSLISADLKSRGRGLTNTFNSADAKFMQPKLFFTIRKAVPGEDNL